MNLSDAGLDLIISSEGKLKPLGDGRYMAYRCPAGVWTIYTGCTEGVKEGMIVTEDEGREMFRRELAKHEGAVTRLVTVDMTQGQFDALVSFSYNCGSGNLAKSGILKKLNKGDHAGACREFAKWDKITDPKTKEKRPLRGLTIRRAREAAMFATRDDEPAMAQKVDVPKDPMTALQAVTVAAPVAAGAIPAVQAVTEAVKPIPAPKAIPSLPKPPQEILDTAGLWKGWGSTVTEFGAFAVANKLTVAVIVLACGGLMWWTRRAEQ